MHRHKKMSENYSKRKEKKRGLFTSDIALKQKFTGNKNVE